MLSEKFRKELKKGLPHLFYFLWSKENFFLEEALAGAVEVVIGSYQRDFNYDIFYPSASPEEILSAAFTIPFLAPRRLVVLRDFHQFSTSQIDALIPYFKNPCETTCMIILSLREPKLNIDITRNIYSLGIKESDIPAWLKQEASKKGFKITESAVQYLIESIGPDIGLLNAELEKLALSGLKVVEIKDIISSVDMMREYISFDLVDALIEGQKTRVFRILKSLTEGKTADAHSILGALNWHYKQLYNLWENNGEKPLKMRTFTFRRLLKYLPSFTQESFYEIFQSLHEADLRIKTSGKPELALEILLLKLLQLGAKS